MQISLSSEYLFYVLIITIDALMFIKASQVVAYLITVYMLAIVS